MSFLLISALNEPEEREKLTRSLGPNSKVLLLTNHGALCCGETIEEAFYHVQHIVKAAEAQLNLLPAGLDNLISIPEETRKAIYDASRKPPEGTVVQPPTQVDNKEKFAHHVRNSFPRFWHLINKLLCSLRSGASVELNTKLWWGCWTTPATAPVTSTATRWLSTRFPSREATSSARRQSRHWDTCWRKKKCISKGEFDWQSRMARCWLLFSPFQTMEEGRFPQGRRPPAMVELAERLSEGWSSGNRYNRSQENH